jgi:hypothetical protein
VLGSKRKRRCAQVQSLTLHDALCRGGLLAYFGWSKAHEDEAEQAFQTGPSGESRRSRSRLRWGGPSAQDGPRRQPERKALLRGERDHLLGLFSGSLGVTAELT